MTDTELLSALAGQTSIVLNLLLACIPLLIWMFRYERRNHDVAGQVFSGFALCCMAVVVTAGTFAPGAQNFWPLVAYIWRGILA